MRRIELLDYARLIAALAVLAFHYLFNGMRNGKVASITHVPGLADVAMYGYLGVDLFFMISGYVIFNTARGKTAGQFLTSRVVRLYPAFWVAVLFTASFAAFLGGDRMSVTLPQVIANLTMVPELFDYGRVDGVYWTLVLELKFYALVLLFLLLGLQRHLERMFLCWPVVMLAAWYLGFDRYVYMGSYFPYFAAGALFAMMRDRVTVQALGAVAICLFLVLQRALRRTAGVNANLGLDYSAEIVCAIIVLLFAFFFVMNTRRALALRLPASRLAGGLTYPIYLIHAHVGYMLLSHFATDENKAVVYPLVIAFVAASAYAIHVLVEQRLAGFWHGLFAGSVGRMADAVQAALTRRPARA